MSAEFTGESSLTINQVSSYLKYLEGKIETEPNVDGQSRKFATAIYAEYNGIDNPIFKGSKHNLNYKFFICAFFFLSYLFSSRYISQPN